MTKERSGKLPTSFNLDPRLVQRLRELCPRLHTKISPFVEAILAERVAHAEAQLAHPDAPAAAPAPPAGNLVPFPDLLAGLDPDDAWLVYQLAAILRDRPQGDVFHLLDATLHKAVRAYVAQTGQTDQAKVGTEKYNSPKLQSLESATEADTPWLELLVKVLHSRKPGLPTAVQNNLHEFAWADEAWNELQGRDSPLVSPAAAAAGRRRAAPHELAPPAPAPGGPDADRTGAARSGEILDALEKADEAGARRTQRAPRKAR